MPGAEHRKFNKAERVRRLPLLFSSGGDSIQSLQLEQEKCSFGTGRNRTVEITAEQARHDLRVKA